MELRQQLLLVTWVSPYGLVQNLIDYVVVNQKWKKSMLDTRTFKGCSVPSGHKLEISKIRIKLKPNQEKSRSIKFDVDKLRNESDKQHYEVNVARKFVTLSSDTKHVATWMSGYERSNSKPWFSDEAKALSEERQRLRVQRAMFAAVRVLRNTSQKKFLDGSDGHVG
ncbi:craniofacial development protein 2-like [Macrobrachium nipponense]|uniref:craniofacial development protein 2-like n=1 Tax=Macrobrachium nipponense TaxID=159736 RepID=UPI0030C87C50